jgi:general secretion pathway protein G
MNPPNKAVSVTQRDAPLQSAAADLSTASLGRRHAFTLIELLVVVAVIAILAGLTLAALGGVNDRAARSRARSEISAIANALETYRSKHGSYPTNLITSAGGVSVTTLPYATISNWYAPPPGSLMGEGTAGAYLTDPFGNAYTYLFPQPVRNLATYDLYSGGKNAKETNGWIGNW